MHIQNTSTEEICVSKCEMKNRLLITMVASTNSSMKKFAYLYNSRVCAAQSGLTLITDDIEWYISIWIFLNHISNDPNENTAKYVTTIDRVFVQYLNSFNCRKDFYEIAVTIVKVTAIYNKF